MAHVLGFAILLGIVSVQSVTMQGENVHCIEDRAHTIRYDIEGEPNDGSSLDGVQRAVISVNPAPMEQSKCNLKSQINPSGDKQLCYGVNQDSTCKAAKDDIPIKDNIDCKECFGSVSADVFYNLNYSMTQLHSVEVGLRDIDLRASASLHTNLNVNKPVTGSLTVPGSDKKYTIINKLVGCPVCVKVDIEVALPTSIDYSLTLNGQAEELQGGAQIDLNLGDNVIHYDHGKGWSHETHDPKVTVTPLLMGTAKATADLNIQIKSSAQINVNNIIWYHLNMDPTLDTHLTFNGGLLHPHAQICINGGVSFEMNQEANLDWKFLKWHAKDHWGPKQLYSWSKPSIIHGCKDIEKTDVLVV